MAERRKMLLVGAVIRVISGFFLIGLLVFGSAGTLDFPKAWILLIAFALPVILFGLYLAIKKPETLKGRMSANENRSTQKGVILVTGVAFIASFSLAGLDHRFSWSQAPFWVTVIGLVLMIAGYGLFIATTLQNSYASRVVMVKEGQRVVTTGLYKLVRHPMYSAYLLVCLPMPLILGSYLALLPMLAIPATLVFRINDEETLLKRDLDGYTDYMEKTRYRLIPFIW